MIRFIVWPGVPKIAGIACVSVLFFERSICCKMTGAPAAAWATEVKLARRVKTIVTLLKEIAIVRISPWEVQVQICGRKDLCTSNMYKTPILRSTIAILY